MFSVDVCSRNHTEIMKHGQKTLRLYYRLCLLHLFNSNTDIRGCDVLLIINSSFIFHIFNRCNVLENWERIQVLVENIHFSSTKGQQNWRKFTFRGLILLKVN